MTQPKTVPEEYWPQFCQHCVELRFHITGIGEAAVRVENVGMMGAPVVYSENPPVSGDYVFICPSCDNHLRVYETQET